MGDVMLASSEYLKEDLWLENDDAVKKFKHYSEHW